MTGLLVSMPRTFSTGVTIAQPSRNPLASRTGALLLVDPTDPFDPWPSGVPANGSTIKNLACWQLATLLNNPGLARYTEYQCPWVSTFQSADMIMGRTTKGGLEGIPSNVNNTNANRGAYFMAPLALLTYIFNNPNNNYFVGLIGEVTRLQVSGNFPRGVSMTRLSNASNARGFIGSTGAGVVAGGSRDYMQPSGATKTGSTLGQFVGCFDAASWPSTPTSPTDVELACGFGDFLEMAPNVNHSWIFRMLYVEDRTVSGQTYAQCRAALLAEAAAGYATGGRWDGDTYTDPATFP